MRAILVVALAFSPVMAWAQPATPLQLDTVFLRNGGLYRGRVMEIVPDDHVTVVIERGETKKIPWAEVDRVVIPNGGDSGEGIEPPPTRKIPTAETTPPQTFEAGPRVYVHIASPKKVVLYRRPVGSQSWSLVCHSPCDEQVPAAGSYRFDGNGISRTKEFGLQTTKSTTHVELRLDPSSTTGIVLGGVATSLGVLAAYVGLVVGLGKDASSGTQRDGLIAFAIGTVLTVTGIFIYRNSSSSSVSQQTTEGRPPTHADPWAPDQSKTMPTAMPFLREAWNRGVEGTQPSPATFPVLLTHEF